MTTILIPTTPERHERLHHCLQSLQRNCTLPVIVSLCFEPAAGATAPTLRLARAAAKGPVMCLNDDMEVLPGCIEALHATWLERGGLCFPADGIQDGDLACVPYCHRDYLLENFHAGYIHNFADTELTLRARQRGELHYVPQAKLLHHHWTKGAPHDDTYGKQRASWAHDKALFAARNPDAQPGRPSSQRAQLVP